MEQRISETGRSRARLVLARKIDESAVRWRKSAEDITESAREAHARRHALAHPLLECKDRHYPPRRVPLTIHESHVPGHFKEKLS